MKKAYHLNFTFAQDEINVNFDIFVCYSHLIFVLLKTKGTLAQLSENHHSGQFIVVPPSISFITPSVSPHQSGLLLQKRQLLKIKLLIKDRKRIYGDMDLVTESY